MIAEAIQAVTEMANRAQEARVVHLPQEADDVYLLQKPDGTVERRIAEPAPRNYQLFTLYDLAVAIREIPARDRRVVFVGRSQVSVSLDEAGARREWLRMRLPLSHEYKALKNCEALRTPLGQRAFVSMLRIDLAACVPADFVDVFRGLKCESKQTASSEVRPSRESLGREVLTEVKAGGKDLPEEVQVRVCVYRDLTDPEFHRVVRCVVQTDLQEMTFALIPVAGELERAQRETDELIRGQIEDTATADVLVLCGNPRTE